MEYAIVNVQATQILRLSQEDPPSNAILRVFLVYTGSMAYREIRIVTNGIKAQIEACLNALDRHEDLPQEADDLGTKLAEAYQLCEDIVKKADDEPDPDMTAPEPPASSDQPTPAQ